RFPSLIVTGTEKSQTTAILKTYEQMLNVLKNTGKYPLNELAPDMVTPVGQFGSAPAKGKFTNWGEQIEIATNWINKNKEILAIKLQGIPHQTGVPAFKGFGAGPYFGGGADRAAHLIEVPENLIMKDSLASFGDVNTTGAREIPFFGVQKPFASMTSDFIKSVVGPGVVGENGTYLAAGVEIANHLNSTLSKEALATFHQSMMAGNQITPGARGVILKQLETLWTASGYSNIKQQMAAAINVDEMLNIIKNAVVDPTKWAGNFVENKNYILDLIKTVGDPSIMQNMTNKIGPSSISSIVARSDDEIIASLTSSDHFAYMDPVLKARYIDIIKKTIEGQTLNAELIKQELGYSLFHQPSPYDVLGALRSDLPITGLKTFPGFKKGGYVPGSPTTPFPAMLHGGEYVINADAVRSMGVRTMQSINRSKFNVPSGSPAYAGGGGTTSVSTVNINVETFVGEEEWFKSMMKSYNVNVLPKMNKAAGNESRTFTSYNGVN
ncbi:hypothetical protein UFOVP1240_1, partial [uncultured Caudovirales phage]